ncbi:RNA ligase family protein [Paludicola sp. MB14-C6]|uniref:ATP-dependent DNA ligase n=1 Tax=Paludihabitans sp. MB14-C6 TaxID=3070656 RepID=UPI0027DBE463|nr:RNA ligase family protein [Paludicola sp. MB14-C6]WMJ24346.1 RNA ligase family protein [Paludicola sp. MB14-C6]
MNLFESRNIKPMLIAENVEPFNSHEHVFELKLDGCRCIAYLDKDEVDLRNKRNVKLLPKFPELSNINKQIKKRCILDGELIVMVEGKPNFYELQRRTLMSNKFKIELAYKQHPACFIAYDILYLDDRHITDLPLIERKKLLAKTINENGQIAISRYIEYNGIDLYKLTEHQKLEGIVAKLKDSRYYFGKRTHDWVKIKWLLDDDFVVCGYIEKESNMTSIVLGQYNKEGELTYKGHVTLGVRKNDLIKKGKTIDVSPFTFTPQGNENAIWLKPSLVCTVQWMPRENKGLNQAVFKGFRDDKPPHDCIVKDGRG